MNFLQVHKNSNLIDDNRRKIWGLKPRSGFTPKAQAVVIASRITGRGITYDLMSTGGGVYTHTTRTVSNIYDVYRQIIRLSPEGVASLLKIL